MKLNPNLNKVFNVLKNKYVIVLVLFVLLMLFSSDNNIFHFHHLNTQKKELQKKKKFYIEEIGKDSMNTVNIKKDLDAAERFGREKYLMKRDNEDIFIVRHADDTLLQNTIK